MEHLNLLVAQDHILSLSKCGKPLIAIEELIWNSLDADATDIRVHVEVNKLGGISKVRVVDNGHGLRRDQCAEAFGSLGGSAKLKAKTTPNGRDMHGKFGQGRFKAFGIGRTVTWKSRYESDGQYFAFDIRGRKENICVFDVGDVTQLAGRAAGMEVEISDLDDTAAPLAAVDDAAVQLSMRLALYLRKYPGVTIYYCDVVIDPRSAEDHVQTYPFEVSMSGDAIIPAEMTVIEWKRPTPRALYLCDSSGFARDERSPGIQALGFHFTAYLKSLAVEQLAERDAFGLAELDPQLKAMLDAGRDVLRTHFRGRERLKAADLVQQWQDEQVYPYDRITSDPLSKIEREVFDVCAVKVHEYLPDFETSDRKNKQLTFRLIREALESNPTSLQTILREVLALPHQQQDDLAAILERTRLASIINAAKVVMDRITFLTSLDGMLYGEFKTSLLERSQLHRILADQVWLFGEQYAMGVDDESLKSLLAKHITILKRKDINPNDEVVKDLDGKNRVVDLMLYRRYPQGTPDTFEHLVIELKRPSCVIGEKEINQITKYGLTVASDERFGKGNAKCRWTFLLVGNDLDKYAEQKCDIAAKEFGHIHASKDGMVNIHVKRWGSIIDQAKWRYEFFREKLEYQATSDDGLAFLRERYPQHLPVMSKVRARNPRKKAAQDA